MLVKSTSNLDKLRHVDNQMVQSLYNSKLFCNLATQNKYK